jgi:D-alanyl-D-alanine carboxypeptidase/D-alanyl-D-alanine-endopeptidase (penicillin-binding protein 4)
VTGTYGTPDQVGGDGRAKVGGDSKGGNGVMKIGHTESPALAQICRKTNVDSDNFYAESLLRAMGEAATGIAVYDSCLVAINEVLEDIVPGTSKGIVQKDGSGLSRANAVTPEWMAGYLAAMSGNKAFVESIPRPGEGTISALKSLSPWKFRLKSGSMGGTLCYSGYVLDEAGNPRISFAIFTNNAAAKASEVRPALESLIQLIGKN